MSCLFSLNFANFIKNNENFTEVMPVFRFFTVVFERLSSNWDRTLQSLEHHRVFRNFLGHPERLWKRSAPIIQGLVFLETFDIPIVSLPRVLKAFFVVCFLVIVALFVVGECTNNLLVVLAHFPWIFSRLSCG